MKDAFSMHEFDGSEYLKHIEFDFLKGEWIFLVSEALVEVHVHEFEY
jgi:hypothetical protein